jgi:hypothetical protein
MTPAVALTDDGLQHLTRHGAVTLCQKRALSGRKHRSGEMCPTCSSLAEGASSSARTDRVTHNPNKEGLTCPA